MGKLVGLFLAIALGAPAADPGLLKLAMPDARVVAGISVGQVRSSPFGQFILAQIAAQGTDFQNFVTATGFDPRYNLDEVLFASPGGAGENRKLLLARGAFDLTKLLDLARSAGAEITSYQGFDLIHSPHAGHGAPGVLTFLNNSTAVAGDEQSVRDAIDRRDATTAVLSSTLTDRITALSPAQDAWFVSLVPLAELAKGVPNNTTVGGALKGDTLQSINQADGGVKFSDPVKLSAEIGTNTPPDASSLADVLRFLIGLAQLQPAGPGQSSTARSLLNAVDLKAVGASVQLGLSIPEAQLESIVRAGHP